MNDVRTEDKKVILSSGKDVAFSYPIAKALEFEDAVVVMLDVPPGGRMNENVFGINGDGQILWQIEKKPSPYPDSPYLDLNRIDANAKIGNWSGDEYVIEPATGKILEERYTK